MVPAEESDEEQAARFWAVFFSDEEGDESRLFSREGFARTCCFCFVFAQESPRKRARGGCLDPIPLIADAATLSRLQAKMRMQFPCLHFRA